MNVYTVESGRNIYKNGKPFVYLAIPTDKVTNARACEPAEADDLTHLISFLLNVNERAENMVTADSVRGLSFAPEPSPVCGIHGHKGPSEGVTYCPDYGILVCKACLRSHKPLCSQRHTSDIPKEAVK